MALSAKTVRAQLALVKPLLESCSLKTIRKGQDMLGELMEAKLRNKVVVKEHPFSKFRSAWAVPREERRQGVILYLHGGGYTCGGLDYALGFGSQLAVQCGVRVFCVAYRLAPENPYPAALEDALEGYRYLLSKGYRPKHISLCGESAGGGLCYSLCLRLKAEKLPMPGSVFTISPWTDLTASGDSYDINRDMDPSITVQRLNYFAENYCKDPTDPYVSPLFGDMKDMPPSLIFAGADEIMLSDAALLHEKMEKAGVASQLVVKPERWHGYLLYGLSEDAPDFGIMNRFLNRYMSRENKLRWLKLDNAAKIYPAARRQNWSNVFRLSVSLKEPVDASVLQAALDVTVRRFPSIAARLRRGVFWYYLQQLEHAPTVRADSSYPLTHMSRDEARGCAFRVLVYHNRIAVEMFHSLTDGTGALIFLKSLTAEYLQQRYGVRIPAEHGVLGRLEEPQSQELEDSFQKYGGTLQASRKGNDAWRLTGTPEPGGFLHLTCLRLSVKQVVAKAHEYGVSVTTFLCAAVMLALQQLQSQSVPYPLLRKSIKILLPVNLRRLFPSNTLRNFALYITPEIQPKLGEYDFREICQVVHHRMGLELTPKFMSTMIATNVSNERILAVRLIPLFIKNIIMKTIFNSVGERKSCLTLSNLGNVELPEEMKPYVERFDFILGVQATAPYNCGVISYGDHLYMNLIRNIREPVLERQLYQVLRELGIPVQVQSNGQ
jgi:acetyl esterase/lipase/NRPS condensation-like uncharacterized protein